MAFSTLKALNLVEKKLAGGVAWIKRASAVDSTGMNVPSNDKTAVKFCLSGAVNSLDCGQRFKTSILNKLSKAVDEVTTLEGSGVIGFNDDNATTFSDVLTVIRTAKRYVRSDRAKRTVRARNAARKAAQTVEQF